MFWGLSVDFNIAALYIQLIVPLLYSLWTDARLTISSCTFCLPDPLIMWKIIIWNKKNKFLITYLNSVKIFFLWLEGKTYTSTSQVWRFLMKMYNNLWHCYFGCHPPTQFFTPETGYASFFRWHNDIRNLIRYVTLAQLVQTLDEGPAMEFYSAGPLAQLVPNPKWGSTYGILFC